MAEQLQTLERLILQNTYHDPQWTGRIDFLGSTPVLKSLQVTTMNNHNLLRLLWIQLTELSWTSCSHMEVIFLLREYRNLVTCNLRLNHQSLKNAVEQVLLPHLWKLMIHSLAGNGQFFDSLLLPALHDAGFYKDGK